MPRAPPESRRCGERVGCRRRAAAALRTRRLVQRGVAGPIGSGEVSAELDQQRHALGVVVVRRRLQRRYAVSVARVHVSTSRAEHPDNVGRVGRGRREDGRGASLLGLRVVGTQFKQQCAAVDVATFGGQEQGARLIFPRRVDQGATIDERPHAVGITRLGCSEDRVVPPAVVRHGAWDAADASSARRARATKFEG